MACSETLNRYGVTWSSYSTPEDMTTKQVPFQFWIIGLDSECTMPFYKYYAVVDSNSRDHIYYVLYEHFEQVHSIDLVDVDKNFKPNYPDFENRTSLSLKITRYFVRWWTECRGCNQFTPFQFWQINMRIPHRLYEEGKLGIPCDRLLVAVIDAYSTFEIEHEIKHNYFPDAEEINFEVKDSDYIPFHAQDNFEDRTLLYKVDINKNPVYCSNPNKVDVSEIINSVNNNWHGWTAKSDKDGSVKLTFKDPNKNVQIVDIKQDGN